MSFILSMYSFAACAFYKVKARGRDRVAFED
jgi:hypothetical protein